MDDHSSPKQLNHSLKHKFPNIMPMRSELIMRYWDLVKIWLTGEFPKVGQAMGLQRQVRKGSVKEGGSGLFFWVFWSPTSWDGWGLCDISFETCECLITCRQHGCRCSGNEDELSAEEKKKLKHKKKREVPHRWDPNKGSYRINDWMTSRPLSEGSWFECVLLDQSTQGNSIWLALSAYRRYMFTYSRTNRLQGPLVAAPTRWWGTKSKNKKPRASGWLLTVEVCLKMGYHPKAYFYGNQWAL